MESCVAISSTLIGRCASSKINKMCPIRGSSCIFFTSCRVPFAFWVHYIRASPDIAIKRKIALAKSMCQKSGTYTVPNYADITISEKTIQRKSSLSSYTLSSLKIRNVGTKFTITSRLILRQHRIMRQKEPSCRRIVTSRTVLPRIDRGRHTDLSRQTGAVSQNQIR